MSNVSIDIRGLPETKRMLARYSDRELQNRERRAVRAGAKPFQQQLKFEGDTPGHPHSFTNVPAAKISTHGGPSGRDVEARLRPKSPLFNIFEPGAGTHTITPGLVGGNSSRPSRPTATAARPNYNVRRAGVPVLAGPAGSGSWDPKGRKRPGAFFATHPVTHPGMAARPILPAAFAAGQRASVDAIARVLFEGD